MNKEAQAVSSNKKMYEKKANRCINERLWNTLFIRINLRLSERKTEWNTRKKFSLKKTIITELGIPSIRINKEMTGNLLEHWKYPLCHLHRVRCDSTCASDLPSARKQIKIAHGIWKLSHTHSHSRAYTYVHNCYSNENEYIGQVSSTPSLPLLLLIFWLPSYCCCCCELWIAFWVHFNVVSERAE